MEEIIKQYGFESMEEFNRLVSNVDLSTPDKLNAFKTWQNEDGSKDGLLKL
jgi:hypothetical protein